MHLLFHIRISTMTLTRYSLRSSSSLVQTGSFEVRIVEVTNMTLINAINLLQGHDETSTSTVAENGRRESRR